MFDLPSWQREYFKRPEVAEKRRQYTSRWLKKNRAKLFDILGNKCMRCGFTDIRCLQIDHINGGGRIEHRKFRNSTDMMIWNYLKNPDLIKNIQLLCANCNWIKRHENKECCGAKRKH